MNVFECRPGDPIYSISTFTTCARGTPFSWEKSREIKVGEKVTYRGSEEDVHFKDHPNRWQVIYETADGVQFRAVAFLFVTEECWQQIEQHFQNQLCNGVNRTNAAGGPLASTTA